MEFIEKVFKFHLVTFCSFQCPMLTVLTLLIRRKILLMQILLKA